MKFSTMRNLALLFITISVAGCGGGGGGLSKEFPDVNATGTVSGRLMAPSAGSRTVNQSVTLVPLKDAVVTCSGRQAITDVNGDFQVTLVPIGEGIKCTAVKAGYNLIEFTVDVANGKNTELSENISVYPKGDFLVTTTVGVTSGSTSDSYPVYCSVVGGRADTISIACDTTLAASTVAANANAGSKTCMYSISGTYKPKCTVNSSVSAESSSSITVSGNSSVSVTASINPLTGTINEFYQLTCVVSGQKMISLEGRCSDSSNWSMITSGSTMNCQYATAGSYTPSCRVDNSVIDVVDEPVVITNPILSVSSTIAPASDMSYSLYTVKCVSANVPTALAGKCDVNDTTWTELDPTSLAGKVLTMNCEYGGDCPSKIQSACSSDSTCSWTGSACIANPDVSYSPVCMLNGSDTTTIIPSIGGLTAIDEYVQTCAATNGTPIAMQGKCDVNDSSWTSLTLTGREGTMNCSYSSSGDKTPVCQVNGNATSTVRFSLSIVDPVKPTIKFFIPSNNSTTVANNAPSFSVLFATENSVPMDSTIDMNNQATLTASGFSITIKRNDTGASLTFDATNALSYGSFSWARTSADNDTLRYTLKTNAELYAAGLKRLAPGVKYNVTAFTVPTNLQDSRGVPLNPTSSLLVLGSFTTKP